MVLCGQVALTDGDWHRFLAAPPASWTVGFHLNARKLSAASGRTVLLQDGLAGQPQQLSEIRGGHA
jgi:hypothetical protein